MRRPLLFLISALLLVVPFCALAQESDETIIDDNFIKNSSVVANVNIYDAVITQDNRDIAVKFELSNDDDKAQPQIRYSIALEEIVNVDENGSEYGQTIDEYVYDEVLSLKAGTSVKKNIKYVVPDSFFGEYRIIVRAQNNSGLPFAVANAGKIKVEKVGDSIYINQENCRVYAGETGLDYDLYAGVDLSVEEDLVIDCEINNSFQGEKMVYLEAITYDRSIYGDKLGEKKYEKLTIPSGKSRIEQKMELMSDPQAYDTVLTLHNEKGEKVSNSIKVHYVIQGTSATIQNIRLDKDLYKKGDDVVIAYDFSGRADFFQGSRASAAQSDIGDSFGVLFDVSITGDDGKCVSAQKLQPSDSYEWVMKIERECVNPVVSVTLMDENGKVLDSSEFAMQSGGGAESSEEKNDNWLYKFIFVVLTLLLVIILAVLIKAWGKTKGAVGSIVLIIIGAGMMMLWPNSSEALTLRPESAWSSQPYFTINPSSRSINTCQNITLTGTAYVPNCANTPQSKIKVTMNGQPFADYYSKCHTKWRMHTDDKKLCEGMIFKGWNTGTKNGCKLWNDYTGKWRGRISLLHGMPKRLCDALTRDKKYMEFDTSCYMDLTGYKDLACYGGDKSNHYSTVSTSSINLNKAPGKHSINFAAQFYRIEEDSIRNDGYELDRWATERYAPAAGKMAYSVTSFTPWCNAWTACNAACGTTGQQTRNCRRADCTFATETRTCQGSVCPPPCECDTVANNNGQPFAYNVATWPSTNFCSVGTPNPNPENRFPVWGSSTNWSCISGALNPCTGTAQCSASRNPAPQCTCGPLNGGRSEDAPSDAEACGLGVPPSPFASSGDQWSWRCTTDNVNCDQQSAICTADCLYIELEVPSGVYLSRDGGETFDASVNIRGNAMNGGTCQITYNGETKSVSISGNRTSSATFDFVPGVRDVTAECNLRAICDGTNAGTVESYTDNGNVNSLCMEKTCSEQGSCQGTPKAGVASVDACSSTCSTNADCSSGRIIETRP